jgi:hypothetical protein
MSTSCLVVRAWSTSSTSSSLEGWRPSTQLESGWGLTYTTCLVGLLVGRDFSLFFNLLWFLFYFLGCFSTSLGCFYFYFLRLYFASYVFIVLPLVVFQLPLVVLPPYHYLLTLQFFTLLLIFFRGCFCVGGGDVDVLRDSSPLIINYELRISPLFALIAI